MYGFTPKLRAKGVKLLRDTNTFAVPPPVVAGINGRKAR